MSTNEQRYAVVSCHVERLLDDRVWASFDAWQRRCPGGFRAAALIRPPDPDRGESEEIWLERARAASARGPFGLHTHWTSPTHARPSGGDPAERVRREIAWLRSRDLSPRYFAGGGWYTDEGVRGVVAEAGLVDLTATTFQLPYGGGRVVSAPEPGLLPATHTLGMLARALRFPDYVHVYFHDTDLVDRKRRLALELGLRHLAVRRPVRALDDVS